MKNAAWLERKLKTFQVSKFLPFKYLHVRQFSTVWYCDTHKHISKHLEQKMLDFKVKKIRFTHNIAYTFTNRTVEECNVLPAKVKNASSLNVFKNRIDSMPQLIEKFYEYDE